ncbi:hypothetical protein GCM10022419_057520 [Nonomuraea rosea]|uniref:Uncharacterized protein n=1 Tax=Nonomuraea rosea TaxID=638574 RepID=A0ABP6XMH4_9ACTN
MTPGSRAQLGPLAVLLLALLIVAFGALAFFSLEAEPVAEAGEAAMVPIGPRPNALGTVPWTQGVDPLLPHTLVVGVDIEPGTYTTRGAAPDGNPNMQCTWARLRGLSGAASDVIETSAAWRGLSVTILPTDKGFVTGGCAEWVRTS